MQLALPPRLWHRTPAGLWRQNPPPGVADPLLPPVQGHVHADRTGNPWARVMTRLLDEEAARARRWPVAREAAARASERRDLFAYISERSGES